MKYLACLIIMLFLQNSYGQMSSNGYAMTAFEQYPVNFTTGIPEIKIPIYSIPTKAQNCNVGISLNYHPLGLSYQAKKMNNVGVGWNLSFGGEISRIQNGLRDEIPWDQDTLKDDDQYSFNFLDYKGKFRLVRKDGGIYAKITESNSNILIDVHFESLQITSFTFFDSQGHKYIFNKYNQGVYISETQNVYTFKDNYFLTDILDSNNKILANFEYTQTQYQLPEHTGTSFKEIHTSISSATIPGYGKIELSKQINLFTAIVIKDYLGSTIKKFELKYNPSLTDKYLSEVVESDPLEIDIKKYKLFYKPSLLFANGDYVNAFDRWGYPTRIYRGSIYPPYKDPSEIPEPNTASQNILQKIELPSGGAILYNFEPNTYYNDYRSVEAWNDIPGIFLLVNGRNMLNVVSQTLAEAKFNPVINPGPFPPTWRSLTTFTLPQTRKVYFRFNSSTNSSFILEKQGQQIREFTNFENYKNWENYGLGTSYELSPGTYTLKVNSSNSSGSYSLIARDIKTSIQQGLYAGGFRIKNIGYFEDGSISQNYYAQSSTNNTTPARQITYDYNFFDFPSKTSGRLIKDNVIYKNVTVYDTSIKGKTRYDFYIPGEQISLNYASGDIVSKKSYNDDNNLVEEENYIYTSILSDTDSIPSPNIYTKNGWSLPKKITKKQYLPSGIFETNIWYKYFNNRLLMEEAVITSNSNDTLISKYYYHTGNSIYSKNRIGVVQKIEKYIRKHGNLYPISTSNIIFSDSWFLPDGTLANSSHLPQQIQSSKGSHTVETKSRINLYDADSHPLEVMQENGIKKVCIWGYNNSSVIAEIENISYNDIPAQLIQNIQDASNTDNENGLLIKLDELRNAPQLSESLITTYTYKPLVGVLSITDTRGYRTTYEYDAANRLSIVKDHEGNILSKNQYHNKQN